MYGWMTHYSMNQGKRGVLMSIVMRFGERRNWVRWDLRRVAARRLVRGLVSAGVLA